MQQRRMLSLIVITALLLSTSIVLGPAGIALAGEVPTLKSSHGGDEEEAMEDAVTFLVRIENVSGDSDLPTPFAPGVWVLHSEAGPLFTTGEADRGYGLEALAEDGDPSHLAAALSDMELHAGVFNTPAGSDAPGVLLPGGAYEFEVKATPDTPYLSFATMLVQSNDLFVGPDETGIALFDMDGMAMDMMMHDVTADLLLWDAGTEANEEPGTGPNQAPRQSGANTGPADGMATVHVVDDEFTYPEVTALLKVTIDVVMMVDDDKMMDEKDEMMSDKEDMKSDKEDMMAGDAMMDSIELMEDGPTPYTVVSGDTLGSIARRAYGESKYWSIICSANSLEDCNLIHVGDELSLPTHAEAMSMMEDKMMMAEKDGMMGEKDEMESDKDDMMADKDEMDSDKDEMMADKDDMESDKDDMMAGDAMMDSIELMEDGPTPYTVVSGDTLGSIAKRAYGESKYWSIICSANSLEDCNRISVGDELMLPTQTDAMSMMEEKMMMDEKEGMMGEKDEMMGEKDEMESDKEEMMSDKDEMESDKDEMMSDKDDGMMADDAMMDSIELMEDGPTPYTVVAGDTLGSIAQRAYGDSSYWPAICLNNSDVTEDCNAIQIGDEFMLPTQADAELFMEEVNAMGPDEMEDESEE